ncbi:uncharacterized protein LOC123194465 [Mangifera indica]|uniref:uncharacterized protein LOC123194465 n=1 Tax=Mangifera indica TaxID=29780 RepID=UPI001CFB38F4|nr:uncharacterized protein LOC123194465 [Mangifera indica]XP_044463606.1 uncharacterized protein LOC123194465 [Mangifera indica]
MAFDQNSIPKDLRPINIARNVAEEPRIVVASTANQGFYPSTVREPGSPRSIPVFYPALVPDAGFVGVGYSNAVAAAPDVAPTVWGSHMPVAVGVGQAGVNPVVGYTYNPNLGTRVVGNAVDQAGSEMGAGFGYSHNLGNRVVSGGSDSDQVNNNDLAVGCGVISNLGNRGSGNGIDQASDEGREDSVSGKKVKFLCSFGGKILPRPSDGMLRYVGGQTRIISVRRDVGFNELVQKMVDTYGQPVVIKYQLPDEDLDALVSVSCPDDLDNMMDEYEERSSDGSAKLRVFLFSASEFDPSGMVQLGDIHDSGQRYVEAVNGIPDGGAGGIMRKESIASQSSTQNSDFSGTEAIDAVCSGPVDVGGPSSSSIVSPRENFSTSCEIAPEIVYVDPSNGFYADASGVSLGIPVVKSSPPQTLSSQPEVDSERAAAFSVQQQQMGVDLHQPGGDIPPPRTYVQAYVDPCQEAIIRPDYLHLPPQMGFPNPELLGHAAPMLNQQQLRDNAPGLPSQHFIPTVHMTMVPTSSHAGIRPTMIQPLMQLQQTQLERCPDESTLGTRLVQFPVDQSYNVYQSQVPPAVVGGAYGWPQVSSSEHVVFSDGSMSHQQVIIPQKIPKLDDCHMCQKALPHAHSDPLERDSVTTPLSDSNSIYHSLPKEDAMRTQPVNRVMVTGALGEGVTGQGSMPQTVVFSQLDHQVGSPQSEAVGLPQNVEAPREKDRILHQIDNSDHPRIAVTHGGIGVAGDVQPSYSVFTGASTVPQSCQEERSLPPKYQVKQEALLNKPVNIDAPIAGLTHVKSSERLTHESPKEYSSKLPVVSKEDTINPCTSFEHMRPIDGVMESLRVCPSDNIKNEQNNLPVDIIRKDYILGSRPQQIVGREVLIDNTFSHPPLVLDSYQNKTFEVLPCSNAEVLHVNNTQPMESYEVAQPPIIGNPGLYQHSNTGTLHVDSGEVCFVNPAFSAAEPVHLVGRIQNAADYEAILANVNTSSLAPSSKVGDVQDSSNSLFSNQDPWNLQQDTHVLPPRPNKIATKREAFLPVDPFSENRSGNTGELITAAPFEDAVQQPSDANKDFNSEHTSSKKGSAEDLIKKELQAVAEGVAASVFQSAANSNPKSMTREKEESVYESNQEREAQDNDIEMMHKAKLEVMKNKAPDKLSFGFPASDVGRLQIIKNSDLEELQELGSGTFGTVYHGKWRGTDVAIKRINDRCFAGKPSEQERMIDDFWNEASKLADLHHPNVVAFYGVVLDGPGRSVATVTEYMVNGSLRNALQKNERNLDKRKRLLIAMDVAFGMEYLHGKNIVHFDLKSDNLLVNLRDPHRPICKVGDLGLSKVKCQTLISGGVRGTLPWMAPELLNGSSSLVSEKVDVFSFGIVMWELLTGEEPYADLHYGAIIGGIVSNTLRPPVPESCDPEWRSLMERCWSSEPAERPSFTEIANELRSMAAKIPPKRQNPPPQQAS